jgi:hypothetical protein
MQFPSQHTLFTPPPTVPPTRNHSPHHRTVRQPNPSPSPYTPQSTTGHYPSHPPINHYRASQSPRQSGGDKRRRTTRGSLNSATTGPDTSPRNPTGASAVDRFRPPPIKPIGFAASREHRRQSGGHGEIPSPVVMGFDYKNVDAEQLKTVSLQLTRRHTTQPSSMPFPPFQVPPTPPAKRNMPPPPANTRSQAEAHQVRATLSIKEQQEALIAQRRRDAAQEQQAEAKGLTFKDWQAPSDKPRSMPQGKQSAVHLSVNTARNDDIIAASRVCLRLIAEATTKLTKQSAPMGSLAAQQSGRPGMMPPVQSRNGHLAPVDPRVAPLDRSAETGERPQYFRPSSGRYEVMPHTARPAHPDRRSFTGLAGPGPAMHQNGHERRVEAMSPSAARREFLAPFERLYEVLASTEQTKFVLHDLHHRYESALANKVKEIGDFKATTHAASTLLNNLQQSTESLKDMVRHEISRATPKTSGSGGLSTDERQEFEEMKIRMKRMEELLESKGDVETTTSTPKTHKRKKSGKEAVDE